MGFLCIFSLPYQAIIEKMSINIHMNKVVFINVLVNLENVKLYEITLSKV